ncbi:MAG: N-6 DNA methylase [Hahellaceae bacterium]|nr:N-6 DNA methylase [Hahellaceae bacterium]MCP5212217.1 N-6 DNA methylase [Hahellaceae bacterium]
MRTPLEKTLRSKLEKTVEKARDIVEIAVTEALTRLGISESSAPSYLSEAERKLRTRLRAHGRQLGDVLNRDTGKQETELLVNEMAYEHWHRMLFARFLEQSDLLMYDQNTPITLADCVELVEEGDPLGDGSEVKDGWDLAGRLAQKMLPQIFRADSPVFEVKLSINHVHALEELIAGLHPDTFQSSDALGWCYQFWQNKKKKQVNESGVKIGAKEISPVTQLFTEPYMVSFLLDNALGAWWAKRRLTQDDLATATSEQELRELASIPGVPLEYLRFVQDETTKAWNCAAGDFDKWPEDLSEFKTLDPCCGSGHFLVAKFLMLVPIRMELEGLAVKEAIDKVLAQNIHGLELDQRCVELAAFALALEAWRYPNSGGYRVLPELHLACSGMSINEAQKEWKDLAKEDEQLQSAVKWMQDTFKNAPTLGSLIDPNKSKMKSEIAPWEVLQKSIFDKVDVSTDAKAVAQGLSKAAGMLANKYQWVITNVPYLARGNQADILQNFCSKYYKGAQQDLANVFLERVTELLVSDGELSVVIPQNWLFRERYKEHRKKILLECNWQILARLGAGAFDTISGQVVQAVLFQCSLASSDSAIFSILDVSSEKRIPDKSLKLQLQDLNSVSQKAQLSNPGFAVSLESHSGELLSEVSRPVTGLITKDAVRFFKYFWEVELNENWETAQSSVSSSTHYGGLSKVVFWERDKGVLRRQYNQGISILAGGLAWGNEGVCVSQTGELACSIYTGTFFDDMVSIIVPNDSSDQLPLWTYCSQGGFSKAVRSVNQALKVPPSTLGKVSVNLNEHLKLANSLYPTGLPKPYTHDLTQWIYHGHPSASVIWNDDTKTTDIGDLREDDTVLQVAITRLLGYRWPAELDTEMELAPEMREIIAQNKVFDGLVDDDGIVCIPAIRGEKPAVDRLEAILHAAYGDKWSATVLNNLLKSVKSRDLNIWLRDKFFEQHCKLFQHRPFIWHIWDGLPDGFSALVNYHQLDYKGLERLIYTYLDDWISTQIQLEKDGDEGAEIRLAAARNLRKQLQDILIGEKGLDIFVRWKSLAEQPIGWNPDLNDGVRLNIRPFIQAKDVGKKGAGVLRAAPNIHWKKDRGTDVESAPWYDLGLEYGGNRGDRINDHHLSLAEKKAAQDAK